MSTYAYLKFSPKDPDRPVLLMIRNYDGIETDYTTVAKLTLWEADVILDTKNIGWRGGEPDWDNAEKQIAMRRAEIDLFKAQKRLEELKGEADGT